MDSWSLKVDACHEVGLCEPEYELRPGGVAVVFRRAKMNDTQTPVDDTQNDTHKLTDRQNKILDLINEDNTLSTNVIGGLLGVSGITIKREMKALGFSWEGPSKTGHWVKE